ncbi:phage portal protein [Phascolarctobacterium succinatutens]|uniref:phage portal protein n=1 Tax=Phascolarctobacterium succinatutens TaxID=626940 RepID=UPI004026DE70
MFGNLFSRFREKRYTEAEVASILTGQPIISSRISRAQALNIPAVGTAINFIAGTVASLPVRLYKHEADRVEEVSDDYRLKLLNDDTGDLMDSEQFRKALVTDMLLEGAGYAYIDKSGNRITGLYYVEGQYVNLVDGADKIKKSVDVYLNGKKVRDFDVLRITKDTIDGIHGIGVLDSHSLLFSTMYNALKYENTAVASGTKRGFLKSARRLEKQMLDDLKAAWRKLTSTDSENNDVMVLNEGISFEPTQSTATETQLNDLKKTNNELVYNLFGLNSALFNASPTNMDGIYLNSIKTAVLPVVEALNTALNKFLLLEKEKGDYFFALDTSEILKGNVKDRYAAYDTGIKSGWLQVDEVRKIEKMAPIGFEFMKLSLADVFYNPKTKEIFVPNTNGTGNIAKAGKEGNE